MKNEEYASESERGKGVDFVRLRRITGYLVGSLDRWNDAKLHELKDRVAHQSFK